MANGNGIFSTPCVRGWFSNYERDVYIRSAFRMPLARSFHVYVAHPWMRSLNTWRTFTVNAKKKFPLPISSPFLPFDVRRQNSLVQVIRVQHGSLWDKEWQLSDWKIFYFMKIFMDKSRAKPKAEYSREGRSATSVTWDWINLGCDCSGGPRYMGMAPHNIASLPPSSISWLDPTCSICCWR